MAEPEGPWAGISTGLIITALSLLAFTTGTEGLYWRGGYVPTWIYWFLLPIGLAITALSIWNLLRIKKRSKLTQTDKHEHDEPPEGK